MAHQHTDELIKSALAQFTDSNVFPCMCSHCFDKLL